MDRIDELAKQLRVLDRALMVAVKALEDEPMVDGSRGQRQLNPAGGVVAELSLERRRVIELMSTRDSGADQSFKRVSNG